MRVMRGQGRAPWQWHMHPRLPLPSSDSLCQQVTSASWNLFSGLLGCPSQHVLAVLRPPLADDAGRRSSASTVSISGRICLLQALDERSAMFTIKLLYRNTQKDDGVYQGRRLRPTLYSCYCRGECTNTFRRSVDQHYCSLVRKEETPIHFRFPLSRISSKSNVFIIPRDRMRWTKEDG